MNERRKIINHFPIYNSFESSCPMRNVGGVLVLVRQELSASEIPNMNHNSEVLECVFVEIADTDKRLSLRLKAVQSGGVCSVFLTWF